MPRPKRLRFGSVAGNVQACFINPSAKVCLTSLSAAYERIARHRLAHLGSVVRILQTPDQPAFHASSLHFAHQGGEAACEDAMDGCLGARSEQAAVADADMRTPPSMFEG